MNKYKSNNNIVFSCKYHIVWCPKYRRKVLIGDVEKRLKEIIKELSLELNVEIIEMETDKDHIHILIDIDPQFGVMKFIRLVKGRSSKLLRDEFHHLKTKLPTLWTNSSFISTVGGTSLEIVKQYIENQQTSERPKEKNKWKNYLKECEVKND
ncbi:MAG: IS200/IS605 family transposase [Aliarcobacter skirrowii]|jgi:putative transposase|uniref:IS200/IS605 family transposase n=1 Tax=Aliarcobacter skirrowii TaxID=28200 RepID=UPI002431E90B|nr:IS200/IS605 family transposase [Aliarcobacter skirrowii]MDD2509446.1 IS200/IS605 family transposase [Aliarcobacter skirrowii]MDD3026273.1 IS200/IS605 family transposase [Aliarcobacter skirrowii]MDD3497817.1 IS200/IS605 family transposase [Aliarcobacter skirrowii]